MTQLRSCRTARRPSADWLWMSASKANSCATHENIGCDRPRSARYLLEEATTRMYPAEGELHVLIRASLPYAA